MCALPAFLREKRTFPACLSPCIAMVQSFSLLQPRKDLGHPVTVTDDCRVGSQSRARVSDRVSSHALCRSPIDRLVIPSRLRRRPSCRCPWHHAMRMHLAFPPYTPLHAFATSNLHLAWAWLMEGWATLLLRIQKQRAAKSACTTVRALEQVDKHRKAASAAVAGPT